MPRRYHGITQTRRLCLAQGGELAGGDARPLRCSRRTSAAISKPRTPIPSRDGRYEGAAGHALRRDEGPHQGRRHSACRRPTGLLPIIRATSPAASIRAIAARRAIFRGRRQILLDGNASQAGKAFFRFGGSRMFARSRARCLVLRRQGLGVLSASASATWRAGSDLPMRSTIPPATPPGPLTARASSIRSRTRTTGRSRSSAMCSARAPADDALVYEEKDTGFFTGVGKTQSDRFIVIDTHDHETSEALSDRCGRRRRQRHG